ncbi:hypothetical protein A2Y83_01375 [Candidatus Falkowbacteria bacterium RBG_13_39_14]|uniref:DUF2795 domain-containing protein n=1 Tax=Candidatus Falkowbacteria bacterium RBG_13_39_14 TaxID=1797985 RepID=A0A1F5S9F6_9BACT|nr:MAG: hypothetical protein A2Y83_01375 [Candidatus Falkowbacteria bacterium RBG_13_39_14]
MAVNPAQIQKFLGGMNYPASKDDLIKHAKEKGADENVISSLQALPEREYGSAAEVSKAISEGE